MIRWLDWLLDWPRRREIRAHLRWRREYSCLAFINTYGCSSSGGAPPTGEGTVGPQQEKGE